MVRKLIKKITIDDGSLFGNNYNFYIFNGILYTIVTNLYKPFAQKFIFRLGGSEFHISLYNALPGLVAFLVLIPGIVYISKAKHKKKVIALSFLTSRLIVLSFALVPFLPLAYQPIIYVLLSSLMNFPESLSTTALQSFVADIFADKDRANAIASRNKYSTLVSFVSLLVLGQVINLLGTSDTRAIEIYQYFFIAAFLIGLYEIWSFMKLEEIEVSENQQDSLWKVLPEVFTNKRFMVFMFSSLLFHFGWQMGWPLFSIYQIKYLGADETWITILNVTSGIAMFFSCRSWEGIISRKGNAFAIAFATFGMAATPFLYAFSPNLYILTVAGLIMGFFTSGTMIVILNSLLEVVPERNRMVYVAVHAAMTNLTLAVAPLVGASILSHSNIYIALFASGFGRLLGSIAFYWRQKRQSSRSVMAGE